MIHNSNSKISIKTEDFNPYRVMRKEIENKKNLVHSTRNKFDELVKKFGPVE